MSGQNFFSGIFQPIVLNEAGQVILAAGYKAKWYAAGTDIPKTIYTDADRLVPYPTPANIAFLDDTTGSALIYLGVGSYKLVLTDPNDVPVPNYTIDDIDGDVSFGTGFVNSFEALKDVNTNTFPYTYIGGYYAPGDGGEGMFYNATSAAALDGGYVQESDFDPTKRWFRIPDESGAVRAASFGYIPSTAGDQSAEFSAAESYAASIGAALLIQKGSLATIGSQSFSVPILRFAPGAILTAGGGSALWGFGGTIIEAGNETIFDNAGTITLSESQTSNPYWFGGAPGNSAGVNATAFAAWKAAGAGVYRVPAGAWPVTAPFTVSTTKPTILDGVILSGAGPSLQYGTGAWYPADSRIGVDTVSFGNNALITADGGNGLQTADDWTVLGDIDVDGNSTVGGTGEFGGDVSSTGGGVFAQGGPVSSTQEVTAGTFVSAGTSVTAGTFVQAKAGNSVTNYKAAGAGAVVRGTGSATLTASALTATDSYIRITCAGTTTSQSPTFTVTVGGQTVFSANTLRAPSAGTYFYKIEVMVFRTGATTSYSVGSVDWDADSASAAELTITSGTDTKTAAVTWANSNDIAHTVTSGTNQLTMYEIYPA